MDIDLETFLTTLYVMTDDWYQKVILPQLPVCGGPAPKLCDSEVLCLALAAQWRSGVPWQTERGFGALRLEALTPILSRHDQPERLQSPGAPPVGRLHSVATGD